MTWNLVEPRFVLPPARLDVVPALDQAATMMQTVLGFCDPVYGMQYTYGPSTMPETLGERFPQTLIFPEGDGRLSSLTTMGGAGLVAHPGGTRIHEYSFVVLVAVDHGDQNTKRLMVQSLTWPRAVDQAFAANGTLDGTVKEIGLHAVVWTSWTYGKLSNSVTPDYVGWRFSGKLRLHYAMNGG